MKLLLLSSVLFGTAAWVLISIAECFRVQSHTWGATFQAIATFADIFIYAGINLAWLRVRIGKTRIHRLRLLFSAVFTGIIVPLLPLSVVGIGSELSLPDKLINPVVGLSVFAVPLLAAEVMYRFSRSKCPASHGTGMLGRLG